MVVGELIGICILWLRKQVKQITIHKCCICLNKQFFIQTLQESKMLPREHLIGFQGFKIFLLKDPFKVFAS